MITLDSLPWEPPRCGYWPRAKLPGVHAYIWDVSGDAGYGVDAVNGFDSRHHMTAMEALCWLYHIGVFSKVT